MIYLLGSILSSTAIFIVFKLFKKFKINRLQAIIFNYLVACTAGLAFYQHPIDLIEIPQKPWFIGAIILGLFFILVFNLMAAATERSGMSVVSVATKMSVALPIVFGILYYKESLGWMKLSGILLALLAVYLTSVEKKRGIPFDKKSLTLPLLVFLGSGFIDTSIKFLEDRYVPSTEVALFSAVIFASAFVLGILHLAFQSGKGKEKFHLNNLVAGIALGIPNYFSIYFIVKVLRNGWESSTVFLINNVGIVVLSTVVGILLFRERLLARNWVGLGLAILGIVLVSLARMR